MDDDEDLADDDLADEELREAVELAFRASWVQIGCRKLGLEIPIERIILELLTTDDEEMFEHETSPERFVM